MGPSPVGYIFADRDRLQESCSRRILNDYISETSYHQVHCFSARPEEIPTQIRGSTPRKRISTSCAPSPQTWSTSWWRAFSRSTLDAARLSSPWGSVGLAPCFITSSKGAAVSSPKLAAISSRGRPRVSCDLISLKSHVPQTEKECLPAKRRTR
jgi:hypothetical protein